ncbi:MAG: mannosylglucosylglycerate synthase [Acidimicrobiaceae bacterium]|nr:mannosylglucosylglycerate synthase [Acidimicrobiaceae bacterium]
MAGEGPVDVCVPGLAIGEGEGAAGGLVDEAGLVEAGLVKDVADALADADVVIVENLCSLPLVPAAWAAVAQVLRGRPALLRHHDLPWQRERFRGRPAPPDNPAWVHVTINRMSEEELRERGIACTTVYNAFDTDVVPVGRHEARAVLGLEELAGGRTIVLQPTRAIARKGVPDGLRLAEELGALYWLTGSAEEGYGPTLSALFARARVPVLHRPVEDVALAYAAADLIAFPSTFEGFGNPVVESAVHRRPAAVASYPVLEELRAFGFQWLPALSPAVVREWLESPSSSSSSASAAQRRRQAVVDHNLAVAKRHFSLAALPDRLAALFEEQGWAP